MDWTWMTTLALPLGIAAIGAATTVFATQVQVRARSRERQDDQRDRARERQQIALENLEQRQAEKSRARAEVLEAIDSAMSDFLDAIRQESPPEVSLFRVRGALAKLSTRCDAEHLSLDCIAYIEDSRLSPHPEQMLETFEDIQRRLQGWHIGHMALDQLAAHIHDGHRVIKDHLVDHGIEPRSPFYGDDEPHSH